MADPNLRQPRSEPRIPFKAPATVNAGQHSFAATTKDISSHGLFFFTDVPLKEGSEVEIVLMLPEELRLPFSGMVSGHARAVRLEHCGGHQYGIAVKIDRLTPVQPV